MGQRTAPPLPSLGRALMSLGEDLRLARLRRRISATLLAERAGMSRPTLRAIERGEPGGHDRRFASAGLCPVHRRRRGGGRRRVECAAAAGDLGRGADRAASVAYVFLAFSRFGILLPWPDAGLARWAAAHGISLRGSFRAAAGDAVLAGLGAHRMAAEADGGLRGATSPSGRTLPLAVPVSMDKARRAA